MGKSIEEQRDIIRKQKALNGEFVSVVKTKPKRNKIKSKSRKSKKKTKQKYKQVKKTYKQRYYEYLNSLEWANIRLDVYEYRGKKCEICGSNINLQLHHKTYDNIFKEEPCDLILLCEKCHMEQHKQ